MSRRHLALAAGVSIAVCCGPQARSTFPRSEAQRTANVAKVQTACIPDFMAPEEQKGFTLSGGEGSAVIMGPRRLLTANHVVSCDNPFDAQDVHVMLQDGRRMRAVVVRRDVEHDVAELEPASAATFGAVTPPPMADLAEGSPVCSYTWAPLDHVEYHCGTVAMRGLAAGADTAVTFPVVQGNSGAGVYDAAGNLVGLVTRKVLADGTGKITTQGLK